MIRTLCKNKDRSKDSNVKIETIGMICTIKATDRDICTNYPCLTKEIVGMKWKLRTLEKKVEIMLQMPSLKQ